MVVYGISGGGPTTFNFALRHPNRCKALVSEVAITGNFQHPRKAELVSFSQRYMLKSSTAARMGEWYGARNREAALVNFMNDASLLEKGEKEALAKEIVNDPERVQRMIDMVEYGGGNPAYPESVDGFLADMADMERPIDHASISVPALIVHGDKDGDIPFSQAE